jgi:hypothetical protein
MTGTYTPTTTDYYTLTISNSRNLTQTDCYNYVDEISIAPQNADLSIDGKNISIAKGQLSTITLEAGAANANKTYILLASWDCMPGMNVDGHMLYLSSDWLFNFTKSNYNNSMFQNTLGTLNSQGKAIARFLTFGPLNANYLGENIYFSYAILTGSGRPITYASLPAMCSFVP